MSKPVPPPPPPPAGRLASRIVRLAALALPAGVVRERYRQEFLADLPGLDRGRQLRYALRVLSRSHALRAAVSVPRHDPLEVAVGTKAARRPLLCRTNLHHHWHHELTSDGESYRRCSRCGKDRSDFDHNDDGSPPNVAGNMAANLIGRPQ